MLFVQYLRRREFLKWLTVPLKYLIPRTLGSKQNKIKNFSWRRNFLSFYVCSSSLRITFLTNTLMCTVCYIVCFLSLSLLFICPSIASFQVWSISICLFLFKYQTAFTHANKLLTKHHTLHISLYFSSFIHPTTQASAHLSIYPSIYKSD